MPKLDALQDQLTTFRIAPDDRVDSDEVLVAKFKRLPKKLANAALAMIRHDASGRSWYELSDLEDEAKVELSRAQIAAERAKFDKLSAADRKQIFTTFAPKLVDTLELAWQHQKTANYSTGHRETPFRAPKCPEVTLESRLQWLASLVSQLVEFKPEALTVPWLAAWSGHAMNYWADQVVPLLVAAINAKSREGDEAFETLKAIVLREHAVGIMHTYVTNALMGCNRPEAWELVEKTLIAAQRQEGLRQSIVGGMPAANPQAFVRILQLIRDQDLLRFSSIALCVNTWFGLLWDSVSTRVLNQYVTETLQFLQSPKDRQQALKGNDAESIYRALWAMAFEDIEAAIPAAKKLLKHASAEVRFVATWMLTVIGTPTSMSAKLEAISDESLQVALMAAVNLEGISHKNEDFYIDDEDQIADKKLFAALEALYQRLPEKPQKLAATVWPWTERKIERSMLGGQLLEALGDLPPTKMLPYLKGMSAWQQADVVRQLAAQKKWDKLTRASLFELCGHASADVRSAAFTALEKQQPQGDEWSLIEGFLTRKAADIRKQALDMLLKCRDTDVLASAERLLAGDGNQRAAGLELLRRMAEAKRDGAKCKQIAELYAAGRKKITAEEQTQLVAIGDADRPPLSLDDALGLMNPNGRSQVIAPKKKKVPLITPAAVACVKALDDLVHKHRATTIEVKDWRGKVEPQPLGESYGWAFVLTAKKLLKPQLEKIPLLDVWLEWQAKRPAAQKDKDGLELLRAWYLTELLSDYDYKLREHITSADGKRLAANVLGSFSAIKLRYDSIVGRLLDMLVTLELPNQASRCVDYLLDCVENGFAHVTPEMLKALTEPPKEKKTKKRYFFDDQDEHDWRSNPVFSEWKEMLERVLRSTTYEMTKAQRKRYWELSRFYDEPTAGAMRYRLSIDEVAEAYRNKWATKEDLFDNLLGGNRPTDYRGGFDGMSQLTSRPVRKETQAMLSETKELPQVLEASVQRVLEIELARGEAATVATPVALSIESLSGLRELVRLLRALNGKPFKVVNAYWRDEARSTRPATLTHLVRVTYPVESDTTADFVREMQGLIQDKAMSEERLLELAFLAPQWTKFVEAFMNWDGFSEGLYWFIAHMNTWGSDAEEAAASAEGLQDDDESGADEFDNDDLDDEGSEDSIPKPKKLSAWERLVLERTPLTAEERGEGAVDVAWFDRTWKQLGEKRWMQLASAAKFAANSAQAKKAQFLADVLVGKTQLQELVDGIEKRKLKDYVRLVGLLPLATGTKREKDIHARYETLQSYKKYARGLSGLTKPAAMRAVDIGFENLARLAGFPDPLRLEWAMEAASIRDLAKGAVSVTKEGVTASLSLDEHAKPQLTVSKNGKPIKSIPAPLKKKHAELAELGERAAELRKKASRIKQSLEAAMCRGDAFTAAEVQQLFEHALLAPYISRLILVGEGIVGYPDHGGKTLRNHAGKHEPIKKNEVLRLAHPVDLLAQGDWDKWQRECFASERVQPFKQVFRELYVVTKQEKKDGTESSRFAGHQIGPRQAMALWNSRGWNTQDEVFKMFHDLSLLAEVTFQADYGTAAEIEGLTLEHVRFRRRDEYKPLKVGDVPPRVFSEVMRDIDLVVSVAHRGEVDPESSASTVEMRQALIRETLQLLGLKNVKLKDHHAIISGYYAEYSLHLGSGNIHRLPGGSLAIIPVHAQHRGRIFLPFADDDPKTAEIVSKVLLLARDEEIMDPMILDQLGAPAHLRQAKSLEAPEPSPSPTGKGGKRKPSPATNSAKTPAMPAVVSGRRRFEFSDGKSNKFWEIELSGTQVTTTWGRIGSAGQTKTKDYGNSTKAQAEYDKLVSEKTGKGYTEAP